MSWQRRSAIDAATARAVGLIVLLLVVAASLRGYLPGAQQARRPEPTAGSGSVMFIVVLLSVSLGIVAFAFIARLRDPRAAPPSAGSMFEMGGSGGGRPSWRVILLGLGVLVAWLLIVWLLMRSVAPRDGGQFTPPAESGTAMPGSGTAQPTPSQPRHSGGDVFGYLGVSAVILLLLLMVASIVVFRRRRRVPAPAVIDDDWPETSASAAGSESLARAAELGLAEVGNLNREPREAIIACYAAMERELTHVPGAVPQDFDTPTEVLLRAVEHRAMHADNAAQLVNLFEEARFSPHAMTERHRDVAEHVLRLVLAELRSVV